MIGLKKSIGEKRMKKKAKKVVKKKISKTIVNFILDETGSMTSCRSQTISGFNEYIKTLQKKAGNVLMSLTKFNSEKVKVVYASTPIKKVPKLTEDTFRPAALTPLYDAIGQTIRTVEKAEKAKVLIVIMTDGYENASKEFTQKTIFDMIKKKQDEDDWTFVFLGADQDAWGAGEKLGLHRGNVMSFASSDMKKTMHKAGGQSVAFCMSANNSTKDFFGK